MSSHSIPRRPFGRSGEMVSLLGWGGFHVGVPEEQEGIRLLHQALDEGVNFLDNAWEYNAGISEMRMGKALQQWSGKRDDVFLMTKDCAHDRRAQNSLAKLEQSLKRLQVSYIDCWLLHEIVWPEDPDRVFAPGGSAESLMKAKEQGKVRYVGFTGHKHPDVFKRMLAHDFPWDAVMMPLNVFDAHWQSFEKEILPILVERGIAVIGMKSFADAHLFKSGAPITPAEALRYTMSLPVSTLVSGIDSQKVYDQNFSVVRNFTPLTDAERADILVRSKPYADGGQWEPFKSKQDYEANEGRVANGVELVVAPV